MLQRTLKLARAMRITRACSKHLLTTNGGGVLVIETDSGKFVGNPNEFVLQAKDFGGRAFPE